MIELSNKIPQDKLLVYCQSGVRSDYAVHFLRKNGFHAFSLDQGVSTLKINTDGFAYL